MPKDLYWYCTREGRELSSRGVCGLCVAPGLCLGGQTAVPAGAVVLRRLSSPADQVQAARHGGVAKQTPVGCRDGPETPRGGNTAMQVYCGGLPLRQQS